jgi:predicted short-subunit dehydrogenase-like oxidoreductase (DUF2520 family)
VNSLAIVGGGRAGCALAVALAEAGWRIELGVRDVGRRALVDAWLTGLGLARPVTVRAEVDAQRARAVVWAVPDRALAEVAAVPGRAGQLRLHLSGVAPAAILRQPGVVVGSLHPLCALPEPVGLTLAEATTPLNGALMALDGDAEACALAMEMAESMGGRPLHVAAEARPAYHAAAALAGNDAVGLLSLAVATCVGAGLPEAELRAGLLHLAGTSLAALRRLPADAPLAHGLTGAVARGDADTLARHLQALDEPARTLHRQLSRVLLELVASAGTLSAERCAAVRRQLADDAAP